MTKERVILAFVAIVAGLIVTSSLFYFYQQKQKPTEPAQTPTPTVSASNGKPILTIESPEDEIVTADETVEVKGMSLASALIVITTNTEDFVLTADENGTFNQKITLSNNENFITVTGYPENGTSETKELIVTHSTEEF